MTTSYPAPEVDPVTSPAYLLALLGRLFAMLVIWAAGAAVLFVFFGIPGSYDALSGKVILDDGGYHRDTSLLTAWWVLMFLWSLVLALIFWLANLSARLATLTDIVERRAAAAEATFKAMYDSVLVRRIPASGGISMVPAGPGAPSHLQIIDGRYVGLVTCYPYGSDLIVEVTMSVTLRPLRWLAAILGRTFGGGQAGAAGVYDPARALLEALHSVARHGVAAATP